MYGLNSVYINNISRYFEIVQDFYFNNISRYFEIVQDFYNENTYLCISFFINYTFLYFLYCSYVYYRKNIPRNIESKLSYFTNLSDTLSTRNLYLDNMLNEINLSCNNLSDENNQLIETVKKQQTELNRLIKENSDFKISTEKLFFAERNVKELKSLIDNLDILLRNGDSQGASVYLSDFLSPNKKRKLF